MRQRVFCSTPKIDHLVARMPLPCRASGGLIQQARGLPVQEIRPRPTSWRKAQVRFSFPSAVGERRGCLHAVLEGTCFSLFRSNALPPGGASQGPHCRSSPPSPPAVHPVLLTVPLPSPRGGGRRRFLQMDPSEPTSNKRQRACRSLEKDTVHGSLHIGPVVETPFFLTAVVVRDSTTSAKLT